MNAVRVYLPTPAARDALLVAVQDAQIGAREPTLSGFIETGKLVRVEFRPFGERGVEVEVIVE